MLGEQIPTAFDKIHDVGNIITSIVGVKNDYGARPFLRSDQPGDTDVRPLKSVLLAFFLFTIYRLSIVRFRTSQWFANDRGVVILIGRRLISRPRLLVLFHRRQDKLLFKNPGVL